MKPLHEADSSQNEKQIQMQMEIKKIKTSELELAVKMRKTEEERRTKSNANKVVHKSDIRTNTVMWGVQLNDRCGFMIIYLGV